MWRSILVWGCLCHNSQFLVSGSGVDAAAATALDVSDNHRNPPNAGIALDSDFAQHLAAAEHQVSFILHP